MAYFEYNEDEITNELLDLMLLKDSEFIYKPNISVLKILNDSETHTAIHSEIDKINKNYDITHFEFIKEKTNWDFVEMYFKEKGISITSMLEMEKNNTTEFEYLLDSMFWCDFLKIFEEKRLNYISNNYVYNNKLKEINSSFFEHNWDDSDYSDGYHYYQFGDETQMLFNVYHNYGSNSIDFHLSVNHYKYINKIRSSMTDEELKIHNEIKKSFTCKDKTFLINKKNLSDFFDDFLSDMNKYNLTSQNIYNYNLRNAPDKNNTVDFLIKSNHTSENIRKSFYPPSIKEHKKEDNRVFFDFNQVYVECLASDVISSLSYCLTGEAFFNGCKLSLLNENKELTNYKIEIKNNDLVFYSDGLEFFTFPNFIEKNTVRDEIIKYIRSDLSRILKREEDVELQCKIKFENLLNDYFDVPNLKIVMPPFSNLSLEQFVKCEIPVVLSFEGDKFEKIIIMKIESLMNDPELYTFKEKIKIKHSLLIPKSEQTPKQKKRI